VAWRTDDDVVALFVIAAAGLLASPVSWLHHWVWCVPVLLLLALRGHWPMFVIVTAVFMIPVHEVDGYVALAAVTLGVLAYRSRIVTTPAAAVVRLTTG
jgi:alpha-1,2-mannosyltransferase